MSLRTDRRTVQRRREEIAKLSKNKARVAGEIARLRKRINSASQAASRTSSDTTLKSKLRQIEGLKRQVVRKEKKIADIEKQIARKRDQLSRAEAKVARQEQREADKRAKEAEKQARRHEETEATLVQLQELPETVTVLFLAANPLDQNRLRLDEEIRAITEKIRMSKHRDTVDLVSCWATRPGDLLQGLNEHNPAIVHFSGHGSEREELIFQNDQGAAQPVTKEAIVQTMMASSGGIRLVFFNACYSRPQAEAVVQHVDAAIGMNTALGDEAARVFSAAFYSAIGFGTSVDVAFKQARTALMLESIAEENTPELFVRPELSGSELVIVKPDQENSATTDSDG